MTCCLQDVPADAEAGSRQTDAFAAASRRADSLLEYTWLYVFENTSSPPPLR